MEIGVAGTLRRIRPDVFQRLAGKRASGSVRNFQYTAAPPCSDVVT